MNMSIVYSYIKVIRVKAVKVLQHFKVNPVLKTFNSNLDLCEYLEQS